MIHWSSYVPHGPQPPARGECLKESVLRVGGVDHYRSCTPQGPGDERSWEEGKLQVITSSIVQMILVVKAAYQMATLALVTLAGLPWTGPLYPKPPEVFLCRFSNEVYDPLFFVTVILNPARASQTCETPTSHCSQPRFLHHCAG